MSFEKLSGASGFEGSTVESFGNVAAAEEMFLNDRGKACWKILGNCNVGGY